MDFNDLLFGDSEFAASSPQQPQDDVFALSEQDRNRYKNLFDSLVEFHSIMLLSRIRIKTDICRETRWQIMFPKTACLRTVWIRCLLYVMWTRTAS